MADQDHRSGVLDDARDVGGVAREVAERVRGRDDRVAAVLQPVGHVREPGGVGERAVHEHDRGLGRFRRAGGEQEGRREGEGEASHRRASFSVAMACATAARVARVSLSGLSIMKSWMVPS